MTETQLPSNFDLGKLVDAIIIPKEVRSAGPNTTELYTHDSKYVLNEWFSHYVEQARQTIGKCGETKEETFVHEQGLDQAKVISSGNQIYVIAFQQKGEGSGTYFEIKRRTNVKGLI
ncbi:hypothetical protein GOV03_02310 [Candidatus Woesearchaeota archaeon]|nr:hypothetical protein [Candidatus Woesearchaeota archaeon]